MEPVEVHDPATISEAIVVWTGWGETSRPARDEKRIAERLGDDSAVALLPLVRILEDEFYESDAHLTAADLIEMGRVASGRFRQMHPELSDDAVKAFEWCYTYDYK
jgi:hypothetical protein